MLENILYNLRLPQIASWIQETLNAPVQRAIEFGVGIGALAMAIRLWLSLERGIN
jgi:tRNA A58 N-methylase Trm61